MKRYKIILKAEDYQYPSKEERIEANKHYPKFERFDFQNEDVLQSLLLDKKTFSDVKKSDNLHWWNLVLQNRLGKLYSTYVNSYTHYKRSHTNIELRSVHDILFDYYGEVFFYFFISIRDIIGQIINIYFDIGKNDYQVSFNENFINKIPNKNVESAVHNFLSATSNCTNTIRNGFAHRFSPNVPDYRVVVSKDELSAGRGTYILPEEMMENINHSLADLDNFIKDLKKEMS